MCWLLWLLELRGPMRAPGGQSSWARLYASGPGRLWFLRIGRPGHVCFSFSVVSLVTRIAPWEPLSPHPSITSVSGIVSREASGCPPAGLLVLCSWESPPGARTLASLSAPWALPTTAVQASQGSASCCRPVHLVACSGTHSSVYWMLRRGPLTLGQGTALSPHHHPCLPLQLTPLLGPCPVWNESGK